MEESMSQRPCHILRNGEWVEDRNIKAGDTFALDGNFELQFVATKDAAHFDDKPSEIECVPGNDAAAEKFAKWFPQ